MLIKEARERVPLYFNAASIHVLCSDIEGSPNSVKESLSCNTPVVATNVGNVHDLLADVKGCYICETRLPGDLAFFCNEILNDNATIDLRRRIEDMNLDLDSVARRIASIYEAVGTER
jgi:glycosyltransferase involved in cell wall biosynthesis